MRKDRIYWLGLLILLIVVGGIYFVNQAYTIYGGDAGDLVSAIVTRGIPHPPGYPLYTLLGVLVNIFVKSGTAAWRAGFLSSIPAILTLIFLFDLLHYLTHRALLSLISVGVLAFSYPFWLYSEVVEVFSLNNLFIILLLWSLIHFTKEKKKKYLFLGAFLLGLALTHHQIIIFLVPSLFILLWSQKKLLRRREFMMSAALFSLGLIPYLYVFIAAAKNPGLNWMDLPTLRNFAGLVGRSTYGTFTIGHFIAQQPLFRFLDILGFIDFALKDFRVAGLILFLLGFAYLMRREKTLFLVFTVGFLSYLFFLFYASFPLAGNFIVGTFERFVLPLYIFIAIFIAFGILCLEQLLNIFFVRALNKSKIQTLFILVSLIFLVYPVGILLLNYPKISILKNDFTAENLGRDILSSVPINSIIIISSDTPLFDSQYVYFSEKKWPTVKLVHFTKLLNINSEAYFRHLYPDMILPVYSQSPNKELQSFIAGNYPKFAIFSKQAYALPDGVWVPWGLLFRYYRNEDLPSDKIILSKNNSVWTSYHNPLSGSLSQYKNLLLSDVLQIYSTAHQEIAFWAAKRGFNEIAESHLLTAEKLTPDDLDTYNILSQVYIEEKKCDQAKNQIDYRKSYDSEEPSNDLLYSLTYSLCFKDPAQAAYYQKLYDSSQKKKETPLKKL